MLKQNIERRVDQMIFGLDLRLIHGDIRQEDYDTAVDALHTWADEQERRNAWAERSAENVQSQGYLASDCH